MAMHILIAPSGFKENIGSDIVTNCIASGILRAIPDAEILKVPLTDGGEGFTKALVKATRGTLHPITVSGPLGEPVEAYYGVLGGTEPRTMVLEMAVAAGLRLVPPEKRNPLKTTTYGVGELIRAALEAGAERLLIGCGDSGTNDGGAGMAQALGVRLLNRWGKEIGRGAEGLLELERIDMSERHPGISRVQIDVACNWRNVLCGPEGVSRVFGPQKGASPEIIERLSQALDHYADVIERDTSVDVRSMPGGGASGGLGTGLHVFLNAALHPRFEVIQQYLGMESMFREVDLVVTAEGCLDFQSVRDKIPGEIARRAKAHYLPVVALAGMIGKGAEETLTCGIDSFTSILETPITLPDAMGGASDLLTRASERMMRLILVGQNLNKPKPRKVFYPAPTVSQNVSIDEDPQDPWYALPGAGNGGVESLYRLSREFRTPLNLVLGYTEMVKDHSLGGINPRQQKALEQVSRHSRALISMITGLLQAVQVEDNLTVGDNNNHDRK